METTVRSDEQKEAQGSPQLKELVLKKYHMVADIAALRRNPESPEAKKEMNELGQMVALINAQKEEIGFIRYIQLCKEIEEEKKEERIELEEKIIHLEKARLESGLQQFEAKQKEAELQAQRLSQSQREELNKLDEKFRAKISELEEKYQNICEEIEKTDKVIAELVGKRKELNKEGHKLFLDAADEAIAEHKDEVMEMRYLNLSDKEQVRIIHIPTILLHVKDEIDKKLEKGEINLCDIFNEINSGVASFAHKEASREEKMSSAESDAFLEKNKDVFAKGASTLAGYLIKPDSSLAKTINLDAGMAEAIAEQGARKACLHAAATEVRCDVALVTTGHRELVHVKRSGKCSAEELALLEKAVNSDVRQVIVPSAPAANDSLVSEQDKPGNDASFTARKIR